MGKAQRDKGKRNELAAAKKIQSVLGIVACRTAQNTGMNGLADIDMGDKFHPEVKVRKSIAACRYYDQAVKDHKPGTIPFVLMREDRNQWMVMLALDHLPDFMRAIDDKATIRDLDDPSRGAAGGPGDRDHRSDHHDR
jgi:hypothetical protein